MHTQLVTKLRFMLFFIAVFSLITIVLPFNVQAEEEISNTPKPETTVVNDPMETEVTPTVSPETQSTLDTYSQVDGGTINANDPSGDLVLTDQAVQDNIDNITQEIQNNQDLDTAASSAYYYVSYSAGNINQYISSDEPTRRYLFIPKGMDLSNLVIHYNGTVSSVTRGTLNASQKTITADFSSMDNLKATDSNGTVVKIVVMQSSLPAMYISLNGVTLDQVISGSKDEKYPNNSVSITDTDNPENNVSASKSVEFKGRGNATWNLAKKPFQIKFDAKTSILGMGAAKKWTLIANYSDGSMLRNRTAFDLAEQIGMKTFVDSDFVDLWIDGNYQGLYQVCQKIDINKTMVNLSNDQGILSELDNTHYTDEDHYFKSSKSGTYFTLKESKADIDTETSVAMAGFKDFENGINTFEKELYGSRDWSKIKNYVDVESFAQYYLLEEYAANWDGTTSSMYFYKDGPSDIIHVGPAWDLDVAFGLWTKTDSGRAIGPNDLWINSTIKSKANTYCYYLMKIPQFQTLVSEMYYDTFKPAATGEVNTINALRDKLTPSANMNYTRWKILGKSSVYSNVGGINYGNTYAECVSSVTNWMTRRTAFFNSYFKDDSILGDTDHNGVINSADALKDLQHSVSIITLTGGSFTRGDVDKNNVVNSTDALKILQYSVKIIPSF